MIQHQRGKAQQKCVDSALMKPLLLWEFIDFCQAWWEEMSERLSLKCTRLLTLSVSGGHLKKIYIYQGSRVRPIWSHVRPNFSRVRLTKIPGRTGASSHSRKEKKSIRDSETLVQQKTPPLGLYRGLNQSEIVKGGPPLWLAVVQIFLYVCVCVWRCVCCCSQRERWVVEMHAALSLNLICSVSVWQSLQDSAIAEFIAKSCKLRYFPNCCRFCS